MVILTFSAGQPWKTQSGLHVYCSSWPQPSWVQQTCPRSAHRHCAGINSSQERTTHRWVEHDSQILRGSASFVCLISYCVAIRKRTCMLTCSSFGYGLCTSVFNCICWISLLLTLCLITCIMVQCTSVCMPRLMCMYVACTCKCTLLVKVCVVCICLSFWRVCYSL